MENDDIRLKMKKLGGRSKKKTRKCSYSILWKWKRQSNQQGKGDEK